MERQQQLFEEWQGAVDQLTTVIGVRQRLVDYLTIKGDVDGATSASVRIHDLVHYQKITSNGINRGWDIDYTFTNREHRAVMQTLQIHPDQGFGDTQAAALTPAQFAALRACARFEGDDHAKVFHHYRIEEGLHHHLREQGIDPPAANLRIEAIARVAPELSITSQALIVVGVMYTATNHTREMGTYLIEPGGGFDPDVPLHRRQFEILEQLAQSIPYDPRRQKQEE